MIGQSDEIPEAVRRYLLRYVMRRRTAVLARILGLAVAFMLAWLVVGCFVDRLFPLRERFRLAMLICAFITAVSLVCRPLMLMFSRRIDWLAAAGQIEREDPRFAGRLETALSQLQQPAELRGATIFVRSILEGTMELISRSDQHPRTPRGYLRKPWLLVFGITLSIVLLSQSERLGFGELVKRQLFPLAGFPPIRSTHIAVDTGNVEVLQGASLTISARATHLDATPLLIHLRSEDDENLTAPMVRRADDDYSFSLRDVNRDWSYHIDGGDAKSDEYKVQVERRPGIAKIRVKYLYPSHMNIPASNAMDSDGVLEGPVGTVAWVDLICSESIASGTCLVDGEKIIAEPTERPEVRRARITIRKSGSYRVELISRRGVKNDEGAPFSIHARKDRAPRLWWTETSIRQLDIMSATSVGYHLSDDYGIASAAVTVRVNEKARSTIALVSPRSRRDWDGIVRISVSDWKAKPGDVIGLELSAVDTGGQTGRSEPFRILISPFSITPDVIDFAAGLQKANESAEAFLKQLPEGLRQAEEMVRPSGTSGTAQRIALRHSIELADGLTRRLWQIVPVAHGYERMDACHDLIDQNVSCRSQLEAILNADERPDLDGRRVTTEILQNVTKLRQTLSTLARAEQLQVIKLQLENCRVLLTHLAAWPPNQQRVVREVLEAVGANIDERLKAFDIDPDDDDLVDQIDRQLREGDELLATLHIPDYLSIVRNTPDPESIARLTAGSLIEALQPVPNYARARDLDLVGSAITSGAYSQRRIILNSFAAMQRDYLAQRATSSALWGEQLNKIRLRGGVARQVLHRLVANSSDGLDAELNGLDEIAARTPPHNTATVATSGDLAKQQVRLTQEVVALSALPRMSQPITPTNLHNVATFSHTEFLSDFADCPNLAHTLAASCVRSLEAGLTQSAIREAPVDAAEIFTEAARTELSSPTVDREAVINFQRYANEAINLANSKAFQQTLAMDARSLPAVAQVISDTELAPNEAARSSPPKDSPTVFDEPSQIYFDLLKGRR